MRNRNEEAIQAAEKEVQGLWPVAEKIIQAYRIRIKLFIRKYDLLLQVDRSLGLNKNIEIIANNPNFYSQLSNILEKEEKLLQIIEGDEKIVGNNINYALKQLKSHHGQMSEKISNIKLTDDRELSVGDLQNFLSHAITFLEHMEQDVERIRVRMGLERTFIRRMESDEDHAKKEEDFNFFIRAWEQEVRNNEEMLKHFHNMRHSSQKIIHSVDIVQGVGEGEAAIVGGFMGGAAALAGGLAIGNPAVAIIGAVVGLSIVVFGIMASIDSTYKMGFRELEQERLLIRDFENKRVIEKNSFWHRLLGQST
ncbi:MAG: hypothetical protein GY861_23480 [bacterium]|nr:hypothetical protein [bacterium]